jgi:hypothetical protein
MFLRLFFVSALVACAGCGDSTSPSEPPANLAGAWTGQMGTSASGTALRVTWTATQSGSTATGPARLVKPSVGTEIPGTLSATINGNQAALNFSAAPGNVPTVPACTAAGTGSGTIGANSILGTLNLTATACDSIGIENASSGALLMTR